MGNKVDGMVMAWCPGGIVVVAVAMLQCAAFAGGETISIFLEGKIQRYDL
jgi:hypothetical protein